MDKSESSRLKYRNQYILAPAHIECQFQHKTYKVGENYTLFAHSDLLVTSINIGHRHLILLGDLFDYQNPGSDNDKILNELIALDFEQILTRVGSYAGRFVIIYCKDEEFKVFHDATATRKVFYYTKGQSVWFSSQPHLLASVLGLEITKDPEKLDFFRSTQFIQLLNSSIGNLTIYDEIFQLLPNHYFEISDIEVKRYWPQNPILKIPDKEVASQSANMLRGIMESITNRYEVMLPLTAGKDSRTLLAATKGLSDRIFFYINKENRLSENDPDIDVPRRLLEFLGLDYHILNPYPDMDKDFQEAYFKNNPYASTDFLPIIYNYYCNFRDKVNLPGNTASGGYEHYRGKRMRITGNNLAKLNGVESWEFARNYYQSWINKNEKIFLQNQIGLLAMFYWEERLANWGTQIQIEKDIAQEDINPFNSRDLAQLYLSVDPSQIETPFFRLHHRVIRLLWPEVLKIPINHSRRTMAVKAAKVLGILDLYYHLKYSRINGF